jgi:DNA-directed RNA polymerase subunit H (RpoH/RPB5)
MTTSTTILTKIHKSRNVILEILDSLDYDVKDYVGLSVNEVNTMMNNNQLDMLLEKKNKKSKIYIRYYFEKTIKYSNLMNIVDDLFNLTQTLDKNDVLFIIKEDEINETLIHDLRNIWETKGIFIVVEKLKCLQFNKLKHYLQPEFSIIDDENKIRELMIKYKINDMSQFPQISRMDPVARVLCLRPGQLLHIKRASKSAIETDYYRACMSINSDMQTI